MTPPVVGAGVTHFLPPRPDTQSASQSVHVSKSLSQSSQNRKIIWSHSSGEGGKKRSCPAENQLSSSGCFRCLSGSLSQSPVRVTGVGRGKLPTGKDAPLLLQL